MILHGTVFLAKIPKSTAIGVLFLAIGLGIAAIAIGRIEVASVAQAVWNTRPSIFWLSLCLSVFGMASMGFYDVLALRTAAPGVVGDGFAWATGVKAYGISNLLGFAMLTGGAVRFPIYRAKGIDIGALANAMAMSWAAFWLVVMGVAGGVLLLQPCEMAALFGVTTVILRCVGVALLAGVTVVVGVIGTGTRSLRFRRFVILFPTPPLALAQTGVALTEVLLASGALFALLPNAAGLSFSTFFAAYVVAVSVGLISHSPGGLGAFEATLLVLTGLAATPQVLAALLVYRLVRFIIPFGLVSLWLTLDWTLAAWGRRQEK